MKQAVAMIVVSVVTAVSLSSTAGADWPIPGVEGYPTQLCTSADEGKLTLKIATEHGFKIYVCSLGRWVLENVSL